MDDFQTFVEVEEKQIFTIDLIKVSANLWFPKVREIDSDDGWIISAPLVVKFVGAQRMHHGWISITTTPDINLKICKRNTVYNHFYDG